MMIFKNSGATMLSLVVSTLGMFAMQTPSLSETIYVKPAGEYATIDVKENNAVGAALLHGTSEERSRLVQQVLAHPDRYNPAILCLVSRDLFANGKKDEAAFWFYAGQLRSRTDGQLCNDISARSGTEVLTQEFGRPVNRYMFQNIQKLKEMVPRVVEWDSATGHNYDRRWIALHGLGAFGTDDGGTIKSITTPKSDWLSSDKQTREKYYLDFQEAMSELAKAPTAQ